MDGLNSCQGFSIQSSGATTESDSLCLHKKSIPVRYMDAFVKQIPVSETIFGNIKKPPGITCVEFFWSVCIQKFVLMSESVFFMILSHLNVFC